MKKYIALLGMVAVLFTSCEDFLNLTPKNKKVVYSIDEVNTAMSSYLLAMIYSYAYANGNTNASNAYRLNYNGQSIYFPMHRNVEVAMALYADDMELESFVQGTDKSGGYPYRTYYYELQDWNGMTMPAYIWRFFFVNVGYLNNLLKDLENAPDKTQEEYERISGEARVFRAYYLFKLNQYFAPLNDNNLGIPMNLNSEVYTSSERLKQTEVYKTIIAELQEVSNYTTEPKASWNIMYNKEIINALLAQIYMFKACSCAAESTDWANAEKYSANVMANRSIETTVDEYLDLFTPTSQQIVKNNLFALIKIEKWGDYLGNNYSPWGNPGEEVQVPSKDLIALFKEQPNDVRNKAFFRTAESGVKNTFVAKIKYGNEDVDNCTILFRTSEMALIHAEALARQNKGAALEALNTFRRAKGCSDYSGGNVLEEILKERRKEFCFEGDYRWLDMKRLGVSVTRTVLDKDTNEPKVVSLEANDYRYAMPISVEYELQYNPIQQNPGWDMMTK